MMTGSFARLGGLTGRERIFVSAGVIFVIMFVLYIFVIAPLWEKKDTVRRRLLEQERDIIELQLLQREYQRLAGNEKAIVDAVSARPPDFDLFGFLERKTAAARLKSRVSSMKPITGEWNDGYRQAEIEMRIERVLLSQLVDFLLQVESFDRAVFVKRMVVQKNRENPDLLDAVVTVVTFEQGRTK